MDLPIEERPQPHANRDRKDELGNVTPHPPLRGFASSEKVLRAAPLPLAVPSLRVVRSASCGCFGPALYASFRTRSNRNGGRPPPAPTVPAPRLGTSPAPRALVHFHEGLSLWPYPRALLDSNSAKHSKRDKVREREETEPFVGCARKGHYAQSRRHIVTRASDFMETVTTTTVPSCRRRCPEVASNFTSTRTRWIIYQAQSPSAIRCTLTPDGMALAFSLSIAPGPVKLCSFGDLREPKNDVEIFCERVHGTAQYRT